jgi:phage-related protein
MGTYGTCSETRRRIVLLHGFVKKARETPHREIETALSRMKRVEKGEQE